MSDEGLDVGTLSGRIELVDNLTTVVDKVVGALEQVQQSFIEVGKDALSSAVGFFSAQAAMDAVKKAGEALVDVLKEITIEGGRIAAVEGNFEHLTQQAGQLSSELINGLTVGTHGTITEFELMKTANDNLLAGIQLTSAQYKELGNAAFAIAQAKGIDTANAMDMLNNAVLRGNDRMLKRIGIHADMAAAEARYAAALGVDADHLSQEGQLEARREAVLEAVGKVTGRLGEQTETMNVKVQQSKVYWTNLIEELGETVAESPVILGAFDGIRDALKGAFGGDQQETVHKLAGFIDDAAIEIVHLGQYAIEVGRVIGVGFIAAFNTFEFGAQIVEGAAMAFFELAKGAKIAWDVLSGSGSITQDLTLFDDKIKAMGKDMLERDNQMLANVEAEKKWSTSMDQLKVGLMQTEQKMKDAQAANAGWKKDEDKAADSANNFNGALDKTGKTIEMTKEELKKFKESWTDLNSMGATYQETLLGVDSKMKDSIMYYAQMGAKVEQLTGAFPGLTKSQAEAAVASVKAAKDIQKVYDETFSIISKAHGDNINDWIEGERRKLNATLEAKRLEGTLTQQALDAEMGKFNATINAEIAKRAEQQAGSRAAFQKEYDDAKNLLDLMKNDSGDFQQSDIRAQQLIVNEKLRNLNTWRVQDHQALQDHKKETDDTYNAEIKKIEELNHAFRDLHETMAGGAFDVSSQNFEAALKQQITSGGWNPSGIGSNIDINKAFEMAHKGYSFSEILQYFTLLKNGGSGTPPPPQGPRIPGFKDGGVGDFGSGTLAMLHGREAIVPLTNSDIAHGQLDDTLMNAIMNGASFSEVGRQTNFTAAEVKQMFENRMPDYTPPPNTVNVYLDGRLVHRSITNAAMSEFKATRKSQAAA